MLLFWSDRREFVCLAHRLEAVCFMGSIAEWFGLAETAAAERNTGAAVQIIPVPVHIDDLDLFPFDPVASVVIDDDFY